MFKQIMDAISGSRIVAFMKDVINSVKNFITGSEVVTKSKEVIDGKIIQDEERTKTVSTNTSISYSVNKFSSFVSSRKVSKIFNNKFFKGILKIGSIAATAIGLGAIVYIAIKILPTVLTAIAVTLAVMLIVEVVLAIFNTAIPAK